MWKGSTSLRYIRNGTVGSSEGIEPDHPILNSARGCFETLLVLDGKIEFLAEHLERAHRTCREFLSILPMRYDFQKFWDNLKEDIETLAQHNPNGSERLKILFFEGREERDWEYLADKTEYRWKSGSVRLTPYLDEAKLFSPAQCEHKLLNYWPHAHIRSEAIRAGFDDALRLSADGILLETSIGNIFFRKSKTYYFPKPKGLLSGIIVSKLQENLRQQSAVKFLDLTMDELTGMEEAFVSNSLLGVSPVGEIGSVKFTVSPDRVRLLNVAIGGAYARRFDT